MNTGFVTGILGDLWVDLHNPAFVWQVAVLAFCLGFAWWVGRSVKHSLRSHRVSWKVAADSLNRLAFPVFALLLVAIARPILAHWQHVNLLSLAVPLLISLATIRIAVYALRMAMGNSGLLVVFERVLVIVIFAWVAAYLFGLIPDLVDALEAVNMVIGKQRISLWIVLQAVFWVVVTLLGTLWIGGAVESRLMHAESIHSSLRVALSRFIKALLIFAGILICLPVVGIDLTVLSVFGGALGVGLGFGMQRVVSNYVSGFIILLDRSIRMGDMISVGERSGIVTTMTTRFTVVKSLDGTEAIIPNDTLTTSTVVNHSYSDRKIRLALQVQVAYGTDIEALFPVLEALATKHPRVVAEPAPMAYLVRFADSGIDLELGYWILDPENGSLNLKSDLNRQIWREFQSRGIDIPYPRRELAILSGNIAQATDK
jgi:small-conductance mechanosensitive channel